MSSEAKEVWTKLFQYKVYIVVHHDPYAHGECENGCCGLEPTTIMGVASTHDKAEELIRRYQKRVSYNRKDFDIEEMILDGELN